MKFYKNGSTKRLIYTGFGIILIMLIILLSVSFINLSVFSDYLGIIYKKNIEEVVKLLELRSDQNAIRARMLEKMLTGDAGRRKIIDDDINKRTEEVLHAIQSVLNLEREDAKTLHRTEEIQTLINEYIKVRKYQDNLINAGRSREAEKLGRGIQSERYEEIRKQVTAMGDSAVAQIRTLGSNAEDMARHTLVILLSIGAFIAIVTVFIFIKIITSLRSMTKDISEGVGILSSSATEIVTTTTQVAAGATETSSSVTETTTTVEEVRQTALLTAEKSRFVQDSASRVSMAVEEGKQSVAQTIEGMTNIRNQMNDIARIIVNLSELSQTIGEITATVNDIADQSNLLAVNAAIEAVKAGEHGLGFTVVAQEIKTLSEQSKSATAQVRSILSEIQKSVNQSVMATEQGTKAVEEGSVLAEKGMETIELLANSVNEAAQAATQIAASSQQQLAGMQQVAPAMENIKQAMLQNVASTEQSQKAARNLHELGQRLELLVYRFQV